MLISTRRKNGFYGHTHSPETIKKIFSHKKINNLEILVLNELDNLGLKYYFQFFIIKNEICKSYDFKIKGQPIIIEVDGDFWHCNPEIYKENDIIKFKSGAVSVKDIWERDRFKEKLAKERGYSVIRFWESEIKQNKNIIKQRLFENGVIK